MLLAGAALALVSSCSTPKNIAYVQGFDNDEIQAVRAQRRLTVQPDDKLSIVVNSKDPALAEVFNLAIAQHRVGQSNVSSTEASTGNNGSSAFSVSDDGTINYPLIGRLKIEGLTRAQVAKLIEGKLVEANLLKDPLVTVEFLNAGVAVLGDVRNPGEYVIDRDNMTILQALAKAGDLNITGMRENVLVMREENGQERAYRLNLTDTENLLQSPAYYLQQNDVIYVEPNATAKRLANANGNSALTPTFWVSILSMAVTITALIVK